MTKNQIKVVGLESLSDRLDELNAQFDKNGRMRQDYPNEYNDLGAELDLRFELMRADRTKNQS